MTNIKDVARYCGLSVATISRALNGEDSVRPETRARILAAAEHLGYTPNIVARGLKRSRTQTVGMLIPSIENSFYIDVIRQVQIELQKRSYNLLVSFLHEGILDERAALTAMSGTRTEALILFPRTRENAALLTSLSRQTRVIQLFTAPYDQFDSLVMDDAYGVELATRYLMERGHRRILYLGGDNRVEGYLRAMGRAEPELICLDWLQDERVAEAMIRRTHPTAVLAVARQAETAWRALYNMHLKIPEEMSFVAYDDVNWVKMLNLTAVAHPMEEIARRLVERIFLLFEGAEGPQKIVVKPFLTERGSVRLT